MAEQPSEPMKPSFPPAQLRGTVFANSPRGILYHRSDPKYVRHLRPIRSHRQRDAQRLANYCEGAEREN